MKHLLILSIVAFGCGFYTAPKAKGQTCNVQVINGDDDHCYTNGSCGGNEILNLLCTQATCAVSPSPSCQFSFTMAQKCRAWGCAAAYFYNVCERCP